MTDLAPQDVARMLRQQATQLHEIADRLDPGGARGAAVVLPPAQRPPDVGQVVAERDRPWEEFIERTTPEQRAEVGARALEESRASMAIALGERHQTEE